VRLFHGLLSAACLFLGKIEADENEIESVGGQSRNLPVRSRKGRKDFDREERDDD